MKLALYVRVSTLRQSDEGVSIDGQLNQLTAWAEREGHEVIEVYRGDAVLELARRYKPDAVLLDIGMPGLTGFEIARQLHDQLGKECPLLIAITAWNQNAAKELGRLVGFNHYLTKPYAAGDLLKLLAPLASKEKGQDPS